MKFNEVTVGSLAASSPGAFKIGPFGSSLKKTELVEAGIPVAGIENVIPNNFVPVFRRFITPTKYKELADYTLESGDVLVTTMGTIGRAAVVPDGTETAIIDSHLFRMRVDQSKVSPQFLSYVINGHSGLLQQLQRQSRGAIMDGLNTTILKECTIPLPELPEQQRLAAILEKADRLRQSRRYAQTLSDTFLQSVFLQMFGDPVTNPMGWNQLAAGEIFSIQLGKMLDEKKQTGTRLLPYLGNSNVQWNSFNLNNLKQMDFPGRDFDRFRLMPGDILVCEGGEVGRTAIWEGRVRDCCYQKALHRLRITTPVIEPLFFLSLMRVGVGRGLINAVTSSATIAHFTAEKFEELPVCVPPLTLQQEYAGVVRRFERLRAQQQEATRQAEHLFQSLLARAFAGEL